MTPPLKNPGYAHVHVRYLVLFKDFRADYLHPYAHSYCARKFTCHVMHRACALSSKMNSDGSMAIAIALLEFNNLGHSVTPTFLFRNIFYSQLSPHGPKMNKKSM